MNDEFFGGVGQGAWSKRRFGQKTPKTQQSVGWPCALLHGLLANLNSDLSQGLVFGLSASALLVGLAPSELIHAAIFNASARGTCGMGAIGVA